MQQNYNEIYKAFKNLLDTNNHEVYFESIINLIKIAPSLKELEQSIIVFVNIERDYKNYIIKENNTYFVEIFSQLQIKFTNLIENIQDDMTPITEIFYIHEIASKIDNFPTSQHLEFISNKIKNHYNKLEYSSPIQIYINDILFISDIINGKKDFLKDYFKRTLTLHVYKAQLTKRVDVIKSLVLYFNLDIDFILGVEKELLEQKHYFSLNKEARRSIFNWTFHVLWNIQEYFNHTKWNDLYPYWKELLFKHLENNEIEEAMYLQFFIYHFTSNSFQTQEEFKNFNDEITLPASKYYKEYGKQNKLKICKKNISKNKKINIAFVKDRIENTSITNVELSLFKNILKDKEFTNNYKITVYSCNYFEKSEDNPNIINQFTDLGINVINPNSELYGQFPFYCSHLQKAINLRESIIENDTDIMIVCTNNYPIVDFLFTTRTAPKQIFWSHGNDMYDTEGIDTRITHFSHDETKFSFELFRIPKNIAMYNPKIDISIVNKIRSKYPKETFILGAIGRLVKMDSQEYLETVAKIMIQNPNTIFMACGSGSQEGIKEKISKLGINDRFYFMGQVNSDIYGHVIDLYLDPFPLSGGEALLEYLAKGNASVRYYPNNYIFDKRILNYKNSEKQLIYIKNLNRKNYKKFIENEVFFNTQQTIFFTNNTDIQAIAQTIYFDDIDPLKEADYIFEIEDDKLIYSFHNLIQQKSNIPPLYWKKDIITNVVLNNREIMFDNMEYLLRNESITTNEYILMANNFINNEKLLDKTKKAWKVYMRERAKIEKTNFTKVLK